ncbi:MULTISPECIES: hypothetical protein [unclassified Microbacterium]|uniref:hypothetical protein n=1 Tax=unclassified Microbacterium TaxID=2609290 RepID=UPI0012FA91E0|nr:hypothetical protein [Microbacterium sp. MAH-37]MVQ40891.1 hypothetical protein [Microbacterium sp. MAH-37]
MQLTSLLATDGVIIDGSDRAIQSLNDWFRDQVQSLAEDVRMPDGLTLSITEDIAILLAETMIARASEP